MNANELYKLTPEYSTNDVYYFSGFIDDISSWDLEKIGWISHVKYSVIKSHSFDGGRIWELGSIWFNGLPVMITQKAGRGGCDHVDSFVTDAITYKAMVEYIRKLIPIEPHAIDPNEEMKGLSYFYNHDLSDFIN